MKRVHIRSAVNAANVSKTGGTYTIREVCGAVDDIVMNGVLYPAAELAAGVATLEGKPAPAGHPKNAAGQFISANSGDALLTAYAGAVCRNARHEGGRTLVDVVVNEAQAKAHPDGPKLLERLDEAIAGTNAEPIHVSTGLMLKPIAANGESRGKAYSAVATDLRYDHLAILLNERGAGTPADGVGMFLNADGGEEAVDEVVLNTEPADRRAEGLLAAAKTWVMRLLGNSDEISFDQIRDGLYKPLGEGSWVREVFSRYAIWSDREGKLYRQPYTVGADGSVAWSGTAEEVREERSYEPVANHRKGDQMKDAIVAALNAAGVQTQGLDDAALLAAYAKLSAKPAEDNLTAANSKLAEIEAAARAAEEAEVKALAVELATNSSLTADDLAKLGKARLLEIKAKAAPVVTGNSRAGDDEFAGYSLNSHLEAKQ